MDADDVRADGGSGDDYGCPKCDHTGTETASMATGEGIIGSLVDLPAEELTIVSCAECGFSELYRDVGPEEYDPEELFSR